MHMVENSVSYSDGTPLVELFGDSGKARLLSLFVDERNRDMNVSEIARQAGVSRNTVYDNIDDLVEIGAVEPRDTKQGMRYTLSDSQLGELLYKLDGVALQNLLENDRVQPAD